MFSLKPGKDGNINDCPKPAKPTKHIIFKTCPRDPYIRDASCRSNTSTRGMLIHTTYTDCVKNKCYHGSRNGCDCKEVTKGGFIIETFDGECIVPVNFDCFCLNVTGNDRELVQVLYEDVSDHYTSGLGMPVRLLKANRLWRGSIRNATGVVRLSPSTDSNDDPYHQIIDSRGGVNVYYIPVHTMGVSNDFAYMSSLEGKTVTVCYVDNGKETSERCGIPITVIDLVEK